MLTARKLRDLVFTNWPIKVTALVLATVLWAVVSAEAPTEQLVPVRVVVELPEGRTFKEPLPAVEALYAGAARDLIQLYATPPVIRMQVPDTLTGSSFTLELSTADLMALENVDVKPQGVQPPRIEVQLDDLMERMVPVVAQVTIEPDSGFGQLGPTIITPDSVRVRGPEASVRTITSVATQTFVRRRLAAPVQTELPLDTSGFGIVSVTPTDVEIRANIVPVVERLLMGVPVTIRDRGSEWESSPPVVVVTVRGPSELVSRLTRDSVRVVATPRGSGADEVVRLQVSAPPNVQSQATPDTTTVRRRSVG